MYGSYCCSEREWFLFMKLQSYSFCCIHTLRTYEYAGTRVWCLHISVGFVCCHTCTYNIYRVPCIPGTHYTAFDVIPGTGAKCWSMVGMIPQVEDWTYVNLVFVERAWIVIWNEASAYVRMWNRRMYVCGNTNYGRETMTNVRILITMHGEY